MAYDRSQSSIRILQRRFGQKPTQNLYINVSDTQYMDQIRVVFPHFINQTVGKKSRHKTARTAALSNLSVEAHRAD